MRNRFLSGDRESPPVYRVDSSDPARWQENCLEPASRILSAYLAGGPPASPAPLPCLSPADRHQELRQVFHCDICQRDFLGSRQYSAHLAGSRHLKTAKSLKTAAAQCETPSPRLILTSVGLDCSRQEAVLLLKKALDWPLCEIVAALDRLPCDLGTVEPLPRAKGLVKSLALRGIVLELSNVSVEVTATPQQAETENRLSQT